MSDFLNTPLDLKKLAADRLKLSDSELQYIVDSKPYCENVAELRAAYRDIIKRD